MDSVSQALRIAAFTLLEAKSAGHLKAFKTAVDAYMAGGPEEPMIEALNNFRALFGQGEGENMFGQKVSIPNAPWLAAISDIKRKKYTRAFSNAEMTIDELKRDIEKREKDPERYEKYKLGNRQQREPFLREIEKVVKAVDAIIVKDSEGIEHGPFTIKVLPGVTAKAAAEALAALDEASAVLKKHFPEVLYGLIYISTKVGGHWTAAHYVVSEDSVHISPKHIALGGGGSIHTLIHEFGHRYDYKFADKQLKAEYTRLSITPVAKKTIYDEALRNKMADEIAAIVSLRKTMKVDTPMSKELETWLRSPKGPRDKIKQAVHEFLFDKLDEEGLKKVARGNGNVDVDVEVETSEPLAVSEYGKTSPAENFAEGFANYCLGLPMPEPLREVLERMEKK